MILVLSVLALGGDMDGSTLLIVIAVLLGGILFVLLAILGEVKQASHEIRESL